MNRRAGEPPHVVLAGAGHAHVIAMRHLAKAPLAARVTVVTREILTPYSGMLPGVIAGHYAARDAMIDTRPLARALGATLIGAEIIGLDASARRLRLASGATLDYDVLSLDIGSRPNTAETPGAARHATPVKPIDGLLARFTEIERRFVARGHSGRIAVVGGGAGGVELAFAVNHRLRQLARDGAGVRVSVVAGAHGLLAGFPAGFRRRAQHALTSRRIDVVAGRRVIAVEAGALMLEGGASLEVDEVLWTTQAAAASWLARSGLAVDDGGFVRIDASLRSISHPEIFAAGDIACFEPQPLPKSGVYAVRQGPVLAANLRAALGSHAHAAFRPQANVLYLLSTGDRHAIATRNGLSLCGKGFWYLKDWIDRRFVDAFARG